VKNNLSTIPIVFLEIDFSQSLPEITNSYLPSGWQGSFDPDSLVVSSTSGLAQGQTIHFGFTTLPRQVSTLPLCNADSSGNPTANQECGYSSSTGASPNARPRRGKPTRNRQGIEADAPLPRPLDCCRCSDFQTGEVAVPGSSMGPQTIDPVPDLVAGSDILQDPESLATLGNPVTGISADGAARLVLRAPAANAGDIVTLTLYNDQFVQSSSAVDDGTLATIDGATTSSQIQVTAVSTNEGPMVFALYFPPTDFARVGNITDATTYQRTASFRILDQSGQTSTLAAVPVSILRPPVFLIHGLWGEPGDFNPLSAMLSAAQPGSGQQVFCSEACIGAADYSFPTAISNPIPSSYSMPAPLPDVLVPPSIPGNSLGFTYNAPIVLSEIQEAIFDFRAYNNAAAAQVDVVAHSMGGDITLALSALPTYQDLASFGMGDVHKLITIDTPYLGSPLAAQLFQPQNVCPAGILAAGGKWSLAGAVPAGGNGVTGAVYDLKVGSQALSTLGAGPGIPNGSIAAQTAFASLAYLPVGSCSASSPTTCGGVAIRGTCPTTSPLANGLTPTGWEPVLGVPTDGSDAIVPVTSQTGSPGGVGITIIETGGMIHSSGLLALGFLGPSVLDANEADASIDVLDDVINLLNTPVSDFGGISITIHLKKKRK
jgi:pimeloyl-ACP methyl ester carboxylesterase